MLVTMFNILFLSKILNFIIFVYFIAPNSFLIVAQKSTFYRVVMDIEDSSDSSLPVVGIRHVKAIEYDPISHMLYWV